MPRGLIQMQLFNVFIMNNNSTFLIVTLCKQQKNMFVEDTRNLHSLA